MARSLDEGHRQLLSRGKTPANFLNVKNQWELESHFAHFGGLRCHNPGPGSLCIAGDAQALAMTAEVCNSVLTGSRLSRGQFAVCVI